MTTPCDTRCRKGRGGGLQNLSAEPTHQRSLLLLFLVFHISQSDWRKGWEKAKSKPLLNGSAAHQLHASYFLPWSAPNSLYSLLFPGMEWVGEARGAMTNRQAHRDSEAWSSDLRTGSQHQSAAMSLESDRSVTYQEHRVPAPGEPFWINANKEHVEIGNSVRELMKLKGLSRVLNSLVSH